MLIGVTDPLIDIIGRIKLSILSSSWSIYFCWDHLSEWANSFITNLNLSEAFQRQTLFLSRHLGCILLGLFWLFLFRFRNNRIHGISISKRTPILETEYPWRRWPENHYVCTRAGGRVGFPAKNFPKERVFCLFRVNRIPFILFILLSGAEWTEWYSVHSENGIAPKRTQIPSIPSIPIPE